MSRVTPPERLAKQKAEVLQILKERAARMVNEGIMWPDSDIKGRMSVQDVVEAVGGAPRVIRLCLELLEGEGQLFRYDDDEQPVWVLVPDTKDS